MLEQLQDPLVASHGRLDLFDLSGIELERLADPETMSGPCLNPAPTNTPRQRVLGDREQPRGRGRRVRRVGMRAAERCGKHLRSQVGREFSVLGATGQITNDGFLVAVVEDRECARSPRVAASRSASVRCRTSFTTCFKPRRPRPVTATSSRRASTEDSRRRRALENASAPSGSAPGITWRAFRRTSGNPGKSSPKLARCASDDARPRSR